MIDEPSSPPAARSIATERLLLRPSDASDANRAFEIQSDWNVARMLRTMAFPPSRADIQAWFADQPRQWAAGEAYRFAIALDGEMIGMAYLDAISGREANLGYWLDREHWGRGHAYEAAHALVAFAFADARLTRLRAGHAYDNPASGRVLTKLGFEPLDTVERESRSRGAVITQHRYVLAAAPAL
jgi:ribosomal-protein-alanine N-acetyltransferase